MNRVLKLSLAAVLLAASSWVLAHGPTRQKVVETIEIDAPASTVWEIMGDFGRADTWLPMVTSTESEGGNAPDATRTLILGPEARIFEVLKSHSDQKMSYTYRIPVDTHDISVLPVNNYSATLSVKDSGDGSIVTWRGAFYRGYPNNDPPAELNDEAAVAAVTAVYKAGLQNLKLLAETR